MSDEMNHGSDPRIEKLYTKVEVMETQVKNLNDRMTEQASMLKQINDLARSIDRQTLTQQTVIEKLQDHEKRLDAIEQKPVKRWDSVVDKVIMVLLGAVLAFILTKIGL